MMEIGITKPEFACAFCGFGPANAGLLARRRLSRILPDRRELELGAFGGMLDSLADQIHSVLAPAAFIATVVGGPQGLAVAGMLVIAGTTRLAYLSSFGLLPGGVFLGLPVFYTPMILAVAAIATTPLGSGIVATALAGTAVAIALAQVSRLRIPERPLGADEARTLMTATASAYGHRHPAGTSDPSRILVRAVAL